MNRSRVLALALLVLGALLAPAGRAHAASGKFAASNATTMPFVDFFSVPAAGATLETLNLSAGGDTVIHAFLMPAGTPIAGNDDIDSSMRSLVTIPAGAANRWVRLFVRSYTSNAVATCSVRYTPVGGAAQTTDNIRFGGAVTSFDQFGSLVPNTQIQTGEVPGGTRDTVLIVISGAAANAIAMDDDSGVAQMSSVRTSTTCNNCRVAIGTYPGVAEGAATVYLDEDVANGRDPDADGVGTALEAQLQTTASGVGAADSDKDGISDGLEIYGSETSPVPMKLPAWGADPLKPDVFVEADYVQTCSPGTPGCTNPDALQMPLAWVQFNAQYFAPDIRLHVDTGVPNSDPATLTVAGAWGGANRLVSFADDNQSTLPITYCDEREASFRRVFHHVIVSTFPGGGGQTRQCSKVSWDSFQHELGHQLGLQHGGADGWNCKPNYRSPMNYAFSYDGTVTQFSRGERAGVVLNPTALGETVGFGSADASYLPGSSMGFLVNTSAHPTAIDWNRDGLFQSPVLRGATMWPAGWSDCGLTFDWSTVGSGYYPDAAWLAGSSPDVYVTVYMARGPKQRELTKASMDSCYTKTAAGECAVFGAETAVANASSLSTGTPTLASFSSRTKLMLTYPVYEGSGQAVVSQVRTQASAWTAPVRIAATTGSQALVEVSAGNVYLFNNEATGLFAHHYNAQTSAWDAGGVQQKWSDGTVVTEGAPSVVMGYDASGARKLFALFTNASRLMIVASWDSVSNTWTRLSDTIWQDYHSAFGRPTMVYVPFDKAAPSLGRYYVAYIPANGAVAAMTMTEGNDLNTAATARRFKFRPNTMWINEWSTLSAVDVLKLTYDAAQDSNVHALYGRDANSSMVMVPIADGIPNIDFKDFDDYAIMKGNLAGSLAATWP